MVVLSGLAWPSEEDLDSMLVELSNHGRWGDDDELGTLNYITQEKRVEAAGLVRSGRVVSIAKDLNTTQGPMNPEPVVHTMKYLAHEGAIGCLDTLVVATHGYAITHLDAVGHIYANGMDMYNGRRAADVCTPQGLTFASILAQQNGVFTRGVLLDIAASRGVDWLEPEEAVTANDLIAAEGHGNLEVTSGDAVFIRVGLGAREAAGGVDGLEERVGVMPDVLPWLHAREVAVYSGDLVEKLPNPYARFPIYLHHIGLAAMGLVLLDIPDVEPLAEACNGENRHEFLCTMAPLRIPGGTGSPVNPICVF